MTEIERCTLSREGFEARWFPGTICLEKAIIAVGGASCDERTSIAMSGFLRKRGYSVLVLGFYMWKGLPKDLVSIPVDYVEKAVHWLKEKKGILKIAMTGASTGAGYTLLAASLISEISCVIPVVPYDYVSEGTKQTLKGYNKHVRYYAIAKDRGGRLTFISFTGCISSNHGVHKAPSRGA